MVIMKAARSSGIAVVKNRGVVGMKDQREGSRRTFELTSSGFGLFVYRLLSSSLHLTAHPQSLSGTPPCQRPYGTRKIQLEIVNFHSPP